MNRSLRSISPGTRSPAFVLLVLFVFGFNAANAAVSGMSLDQDRLATTAAALNVEIDARGGVTLNQTPFGTVADSSKLAARLKEIFAARTRNLVFADRDGASQTQTSLADRIAKSVYVHPDLDLPYRDLERVLLLLRDTGAHPLNLDLNRGDVSYSARIPAGAPPLKPDPYRLVAGLDDRGRPSLNAQPLTSLEMLTQKLRAIFEQRRADGIVTPGTNQTWQAVYLSFNSRLPLASMLDLMEAVGASYASPMLLSIDGPLVPADVYQVGPPVKAKKSTRKQTHSHKKKENGST